MKISIIAAIGKNRELGKNNKLLWNLPTDMQRFIEKTHGHTVIMGRKTADSIGKPLSKRLNVILSHRMLQFNNSDADTPVLFFSDIRTAIREASNWERRNGSNAEVFVIGGAQIYEQTLPFVNKLYLTLVDKEVPDADAFFPNYISKFHKISESDKIEENGINYHFVDFERKVV